MGIWTPVAIRRGGLGLLLALLCLLTYWQSLTLPLISDDYLQIDLGRKYGPVDHWPELARDALFRCRATSLVLTYWTERLFGYSLLAFNASSLVLHLVNALLVALLGAWRVIGYRISIPAACAFVFLERPHEAVIWYAAIPELLVFGFVVGALLCWVRFLESGRWGWYAGAGAAFLLALLSKESGVVLVPLAAAAAWPDRKRLLQLLPFGATGLLYFFLAFAAKDTHQHFNDGTFSLHAPFWAVEARTVLRLLSFWGGVSVAVLAWTRRAWPILGWALLWIVVTLLPYSFLTYQAAAPSRHTYLASAGKALLLGAAWLALRERFAHRPAVWLTAATLCFSQQAAYVWYYKTPQFVARAQPTEALLETVRTVEGPIRVDCFPYGLGIVHSVFLVGTEGRVWMAPDSTPPETVRHLNYCEDSSAARR